MGPSGPRPRRPSPGGNSARSDLGVDAGRAPDRVTSDHCRLTGRIGAVSIDHGTNGHGRNGHARRRRLTPKRNRGCLRLKRQRRVVR